MTGSTKVTFTLNIGYQSEQKDEFTLDELGYDPEFDADLEKFLEEQWCEWKSNYIDGYWALEESQ